MTPMDAVRAVRRSLSIPTKRWETRSRRSDVSNAKAIAAYVLRLRFRMSFPVIATHLMLLNHTSAIYQYRRCLRTPWLLDEARKHLGHMFADQLNADLREAA